MNTNIPPTVGRRVSPYAYAGIFRKERLTIEAIERLVCKACGVAPPDLQEKTHRRSISFPRQLVYYFALRYKQQLPPRQSGIAGIAAYYRQNHSTAAYSAKNIANLIEVNNAIRATVKRIADEMSELLIIN